MDSLLYSNCDHPCPQQGVFRLEIKLKILDIFLDIYKSKFYVKEDYGISVGLNEKK